MYLSWDDASEGLLAAMESVFPIPYPKRAYLRSILKRALQTDTGHKLNRTDFLSKDRIVEALSQESDITSLVTIQTLFPRTWKIMENSR